MCWVWDQVAQGEFDGKVPPRMGAPGFGLWVMGVQVPSVDKRHLIKYCLITVFYIGGIKYSLHQEKLRC